MDLSFDHFKNLVELSFTLCNPDKRKIAVLETRNAHLTLRFNDLSELTFEVPSHATNAKGRKVKYTHYARVETQRLILVESVGFFKIMEVSEVEDGLDSYKSITAKSLQVRLNDRGFFMEERVYKFFDPANPYDKGFCGSDVEEVPSVVGQLHQQLGIEIDPRVVQGLPPLPNTVYDDWTIHYINPVFRFIENKEDNIVRSFTESRTLFGYDFIINISSEIFEAIFVFDFLRQSIAIKTVEEVTERTNIYLDYNNVVSELQTTERADEIVTILNCSGTDLDIRSVNPTGTNYIANFSHFMADETEEHPKWMSRELSNKIRQWEKEVQDATPKWIELVTNLRNLYHKQTELKKEKQFVDLKLFDLRNAIDRFHLAEEGHLLGLTDLESLQNSRAIFTAEEVLVGRQSLDNQSIFYSQEFDRFKTHTAWRIQPQFEQYENKEFRWAGRFNFLHGDTADSRTDTFNANWLFPFNDATHPIEGNFLYFQDELAAQENSDSYCQLIGEIIAIKVDDDPENIITEYQVTGFRRFTVFSNAPRWEQIYTAESYRLEQEIEDNKQAIETIVDRMNEISNRLNLQKFFDLDRLNERKLLRELRDYWIEADFESDGLVVYYNTPQEEIIDLALKLLEEGRKHLERVSWPRFTISIDAINFTKIHAFKAFASDLSIGKVITIHKQGDIHYYPALTSLSFNLDDVSDFSLEFSNALKPNSQEFMFMDLVSEGSNSARKVSANWQNLTRFSRRENSIDELINQPLNRTLRLAQGAMNNQQFVIDDTGILGRRFSDDSQSSFGPEQVRIINNVMIFTDDSWQTAKTALGRIAFTHPIHGPMQAYGILAESIVGSLIIGNTLHIANDNNTVSINENGITIKNAATGDTVFNADSNGNLTVRGFATTTALSNLANRVATAEANITTQATNINSVINLTAAMRDDVNSNTASLALKVGRDENNHIVSMLNASADTIIFRTNRLQILPPASGTGNFSLDTAGNMSCTGGNLGGWTITANTLTAGTGTNTVGMSPNHHGFSFWAGGAPSANANATQPPFRVTRNGSITATAGTIAGLTMDHGALFSRNFTLGTTSGNTSLAFGNIDTAGNITSPTTTIGDEGVFANIADIRRVVSERGEFGGIALQGSMISGTNSSIIFDHTATGSMSTVATLTMSGGAITRTFTLSLSRVIVGSARSFSIRVRASTSNNITNLTITIGVGHASGTASMSTPFFGVDNFWIVATGTRTQTFSQATGSAIVGVNISSTLFLNGRQVITAGDGVTLRLA